MRLRVVVGSLNTVSRYMVCVSHSYEHPIARCMPPSDAQNMSVTGGLTASNSVNSMLYVSTRVKIYALSVYLFNSTSKKRKEKKTTYSLLARAGLLGCLDLHSHLGVLTRVNCDTLAKLVDD